MWQYVVFCIFLKNILLYYQALTLIVLIQKWFAVLKYNGMPLIKTNISAYTLTWNIHVTDTSFKRTQNIFSTWADLNFVKGVLTMFYFFSHRRISQTHKPPSRSSWTSEAIGPRGPIASWVGSIPLYLRKPIVTSDFLRGAQTTCPPLHLPMQYIVSCVCHQLLFSKWIYRFSVPRHVTSLFSANRIIILQVKTISVWCNWNINLFKDIRFSIYECLFVVWNS